jgi:drug/metabolite transporter, DME family
VLWGTGGVLGSLLGSVTGLSSFAVAACRLGVGGLLLVAFLLVLRRPLPRGRPVWFRIGTVGVLAALFQASYFGAVAATSVSLATLVTIGSAPVLVLLVEFATGRRRITPGLLGIVALALAGLGLLVGRPSGGSSWGIGLAVLAAAAFAALTLTGASRRDDLATTGYGFVLGGLLLLPFADLRFPVSPAGIGLLLALGLVPTAIAYALYFRGLHTQPASTAAVLALLEPLTGTLLATLLLGDRLGPWGIAGAVLLGVAVVLIVRMQARPRSAGPAGTARPAAPPHPGGPAGSRRRPG